MVSMIVIFQSLMRESMIAIPRSTCPTAAAASSMVRPGPARSSWGMNATSGSTRGNAATGLEDHLVEQESEVRLVDPELTLHHLRGQPHFVPAQHAARAGERARWSGSGRPRRWSGPDSVRRAGGSGYAGCGSEEIAGESAEVGWLRLVDGVPACRRHHARTVPAATAVSVRPAVLGTDTAVVTANPAMYSGMGR